MGNSVCLYCLFYFIFLIWVKCAEPVGHALSGGSVDSFVMCFGEGIELAYKALLSMMVISECDLEGYKMFSVMC